MVRNNDAATVHAWTALGGEPRLAEDVGYETTSRVLPASLPVRELARATVGVCSLAGAELAARRGGTRLPRVRVREEAVATAFVSERHLRIDGRTLTSFAPLSGFWRTADGWVRTHANYPHHRARLLTALGIRDTGHTGDAGDTAHDRQLTDRLAAELAARAAWSVQESVYAAGGLAVAVTGLPSGPSARVPSGSSDVTGHPLVTRRLVGTGDARLLGPAALPADGVRVLDLTRVIAGPVATRTLGLLGADVLRVDSPRLAEDTGAHADTGMGKRSTLLDLAARQDRAVFEELLGSADVIVMGYRPGALDAHGLAPDALLARRPGLIVAELSAWGWAGRWAGRRGFDSLVQAGSGIAAAEATPEGRPGALPAQALDHGTGYLLAAGVLRALTERQLSGGGRHLRFSLAGTASWLLQGLRPAPVVRGAADAHDPGPWLTHTASPYGTLRHALPPVRYDGAPRAWRRPPSRWGTDPAAWT